jgi:hypothetical protein
MPQYIFEDRIFKRLEQLLIEIEKRGAIADTTEQETLQSLPTHTLPDTAALLLLVLDITIKQQQLGMIRYELKKVENKFKEEILANEIGFENKLTNIERKFERKVTSIVNKRIVVFSSILCLIFLITTFGIGMIFSDRFGPSSIFQNLLYGIAGSIIATAMVTIAVLLWNSILNNSKNREKVI